VSNSFQYIFVLNATTVVHPCLHFSSGLPDMVFVGAEKFSENYITLRSVNPHFPAFNCSFRI